MARTLEDYWRERAFAAERRAEAAQRALGDLLDAAGPEAVARAAEARRASAEPKRDLERASL